MTTLVAILQPFKSQIYPYFTFLMYLYTNEAVSTRNCV
ncbi:hypothetical protein AOB58_2058 [Staphylococcus sp. AntiMn-1]|nr:hypothetical protein AOB58_2058 [Staphylococcus sp. AntiMn-1]